MAASKKPAKAKGKVKFRDLKTKKDAKGGAFDTYLTADGIKGESNSSPQPSFKSIGLAGKISPTG